MFITRRKFDMGEFIFKDTLDKLIKDDDECHYFSKFLKQEGGWEILCSSKLFTSLLCSAEVLSRFSGYTCAAEPIREAVSSSPSQKVLEIDNVVFISL